MLSHSVIRKLNTQACVCHSYSTLAWSTVNHIHFWRKTFSIWRFLRIVANQPNVKVMQQSINSCSNVLITGIHAISRQHIATVTTANTWTSLSKWTGNNSTKSAPSRTWVNHDRWRKLLQRNQSKEWTGFSKHGTGYRMNRRGFEKKNGVIYHVSVYALLKVVGYYDCTKTNKDDKTPPSFTVDVPRNSYS